MTNRIKLILTFVLFVFSFVAQNEITDALKNKLQLAKHDTTRCNILSRLIEEEGDDAIWPLYNNELKNICEKNLKNLSGTDPLHPYYLKRLAEAYNNIGYLEQQQGHSTKAIGHFEQSLKLREQVKDKSGIAESLNNIGVIYQNQGDLPKTLEYYHKSLKIYEEISDKAGIALCLNNIGAIYKSLNNSLKALEYFEKCLKLQEEIGDNIGLAYVLSNIGNIYSTSGNYKKALEFHFRSLKIREELNDKVGMALTLNHIGSIYHNLAGTGKDQNDSLLNKSLEFHSRSLKLQEEVGDKKGTAYSLNSIAKVMFQKDKTNQALEYAERSLNLSKELGYPEIISYASGLLSKIHAKTGNYKAAYEMQVLFKQMADSLNNESNRKSGIQKEIQYTYAKKAAADSVKASEEKKVTQAKLSASEAKLEEEKTRRFALYGGIMLVLVFAAFMFNRFKITQKQKQIIELKEQETQKQNEVITHQKHLVEEKQKEIVDSINYAKRIQYSLLAHEEFLKGSLPEHFVYFNPKDIVSGDFYWATKRGNKFYLAVCDSTGHGVPGAFMSLLNIGFLSEAINEKGIESPDEVFNYVRQKLIDSISKEGQKDGFDGMLLCFEKNNNRVTYASANNAPVLVREEKLIELEDNRMPVGIGENKDNFSLFSIDIKQGDLLYLYTDGYADQFGGPKGKKFKYKQLNELLLSNHQLTLIEQKNKLQNHFNSWKGELEQVDDVCVIGIRI